MADYKRFIAYFYEYIDGRKQKNAGFAKVELRGGLWRILFRISEGISLELPIQIYGFVRIGGYLLKLPMGTMNTGQERMQEWAYRADVPVSGTYKVEDLAGILLNSDDEHEFLTVWDDERIDPEKFVSELPVEFLQGQLGVGQPGEPLPEQSVKEERTEPLTVQPLSGQSAGTLPEQLATEEPAEMLLEQSAAEEPAGILLKESVTEEPAEILLEQSVTEEPAEILLKESVAEESAEILPNQPITAYSTESLQQPNPQQSVLVTSESGNLGQAQLAQKEEKAVGEIVGKDISEPLQVQSQDGITKSDRNTEGTSKQQNCKMEEKISKPAVAEHSEVPGSDIQQLLRTRTRFAPFDDMEIGSCVMLRPCDIVWLQQKGWQVGRSSFLQHGFYQYRHLLLGVADDGSYIIGVPGINNPQEQYMAGMFGFKEFKPASGQGNRSFGYWYRPLERRM